MAVAQERVEELMELFGDYMSCFHSDPAAHIRHFFDHMAELYETTATAEEKQALFHGLYNQDLMNSEGADECTTVEEIRIMMDLCGIQSYQINLTPMAQYQG